MPDFNMQPSFPIAQVASAYQRKGELDNKTKMEQEEMLNQSIGAIGTIGNSLLEQKKKVAQALALGKQAGIDPELAKHMDSDQILKVYAIKQSQGNLAQVILARNPELAKDPGFLAALAGDGSSSKPAATPTPAPAPAPKPEAVLASTSPTIPMPAQGQPDSMIAAPPPVPVPIAAPPINPLNEPITKGTMNMIKTDLAHAPHKVMTAADAISAGQVPDRTIIKDLPKSGEPKDIMAPEYQGKLEKQYQDMKMKALSNRSGGLGLQDSKVNQAFDLRKLVNKYYDPKTGNFDLPPSQHAELALGLARLVSPTGQVGIDLMHELRQSTGREAMAKALIYAGADPTQVGGPTQNVVKMFVDSIDRQGETAEQLRDQYQQYISDNAPTDLDPARKAKHDRAKLNSFNDFLSKSPDRMAASGINLSGSDAARLAELRAKKAAGTLK